MDELVKQGFLQRYVVPIEHLSDRAVVGDGDFPGTMDVVSFESYEMVVVESWLLGLKDGIEMMTDPHLSDCKANDGGECDCGREYAIMQIVNERAQSVIAETKVRMGSSDQ